jgi:hemolysin III
MTHQINLPGDGGLLYRETVIHQTIVEPWNAFSSLAFLIPAIFFLYKLRGHYRDNGFIVFFCSPLLILGGLGSTFYHAFRVSFWLLLLDVLPILVLTLGVSIYFWWGIFRKKIWILVIFVVFSGLFYGFKTVWTGQDLISANYFLRGTLLFLPCFLYLFNPKLSLENKRRRRMNIVYIHPKPGKPLSSFHSKR